MLKCDFGNLHREVELLEAAAAPLLHLDVMDGHFVPNLSYGPPVIERLRPLTGLPFDAHLMISNPERYVGEFVDAGCQALTFHIEAVPEPRPLLEEIRERDCLAGLALNPGTPVSAIEPAAGLCDIVLVMSVEPGFGGQSFMPAALDKVRAVRRMVPVTTLISIDGGIGTGTIAAAAEAGADVFVCGSSIFDQSDYRRAIAGLRSQAVAARNGRGQAQA
jgi:ribulose-phosphate 3-epimerase